MVTLQHDTWVLVCDGRKALLLQNQGDNTYPKLETREVFEHDDRPTHELGSDVPGRTFSREGSRRSAMEPTDMQGAAEEAFLKTVAARLNHDAHIKKSILVAPARALAVLRRALSHAAHANVQAEFDKDLVRMPVYEIERHLKQLLSKRD